ncbi:MAG TPA: hypothetical protein PLK75_06020 [Bacteroidales bacterium]|nr:hypothetical protein [Bacteroidales bacterium]
MKKIWLIIVAVALLAPVLAYLIYLGLQNKQDPLWLELDKMVKSDQYFYIREKPQPIDSLFEAIQQDPAFRKFDGYELISDPFPLTMEYRKFIKTVDFIHKNKRVIILGVTGSGRTTMIDRVSKFFAVDPDHIMSLSCVPQLEVEYHKQYVGSFENGKFYKGAMLDFLERANADSLHNYVMIIDDIDMIYPSTFFGAALWNELENPSYNNIIPGYGKEVAFPDNFYMLSTTKIGGGSVIKLNDEHFRRLSPNGVIKVYPDSLEFMMYLRESLVDSTLEFQHRQTKKLLYTFIKINHYIEDEWGSGVVLGQWSTIRKSIKPEQYDEFVEKFRQHVASMNLGVTVNEKEISKIVYSANNDGMMLNSNFFAKSFLFVYDSGIFSEASVAILALVLSSITGWVLYVRRKKLIRRYVVKVYDISADYSNEKIAFNDAISKIQEVKQEIDAMALNKKINYTESLFIYNLIHDRLAMIAKTEETESMYNRMFDSFMQDDVISESEYQKLHAFIEKSRGKISENYYKQLLDKLERVKSK